MLSSLTRSSFSVVSDVILSKGINDSIENDPDIIITITNVVVCHYTTDSIAAIR